MILETILNETAEQFYFVNHPIEYISSILSLKGSGFIDRATTNGLTASLEVKNKIEIPKYNGEIKIEYMKELVKE